MKRQINRGFTLVEILIVVVILGILAAIVVPQFTTAADDARQGNMDTQVSTIQNQIELFRAKTGAYPTLLEMQQVGDPAEGHFGILVNNDYLKTSPRNPWFAGDAAYDVGADDGIDDVGTAWEYDEGAGTLVFSKS